MSTKKDTRSHTLKTEAISREREFGRCVGTAITAAFSAPPTDPEAAKETREAMIQAAIGAAEHGAPKHAIAFYDGVLDALSAFIEAGRISAASDRSD